MRSTLLVVLAALASSVAALPGSSDYGYSEGSSYSNSGYGSSGESSYSSGDNSGSSGKSWSGNSSPSYGDSYSKSGNSYQSKSKDSYESKSHDIKAYTKSVYHETKTHSEGYTKTHENYSKGTHASKTHSYHLVGTHASEYHGSYSKETHSANSEDCKTHTLTYTQVQTAENGGYTTIINVSFSTETLGAATALAFTPVYTPAAVVTQPLYTFTSTSSASQASTTLLTQQNSTTTTAPIAFTGAASQSTQSFSLIAASLIALVMLCL
ncbi:hypothetical protein V8E51_015607 [Hyaloscypha variabilis]